MELVTLVVGASHLGIYRHTRVVPDTLMCTGSKVEERCLATVWVTNECHIDDFALAIGGIGEFERRQCMVRFIRDIIGEGTLLRFIISLACSNWRASSALTTSIWSASLCLRLTS